MSKYSIKDAQRYAGHGPAFWADFLNACSNQGKDPRPLTTSERYAIIDQMVQGLPESVRNSQSLLRETEILRPHKIVSIPERGEPFNMAEFFQTRKWLYVNENFSSRILSAYPTVIETMPSADYPVHDLKTKAWDKEIRKGLYEKHLSHPVDIAWFIKKQWGGKEGILLTNGYANIFYVCGVNEEIFAVIVCWDSGDAEGWRVDAWLLDEVDRWLAGRRVFPRNG